MRQAHVPALVGSRIAVPSYTQLAGDGGCGYVMREIVMATKVGGRNGALLVKCCVRRFSHHAFKDPPVMPQRRVVVTGILFECPIVEGVCDLKFMPLHSLASRAWSLVGN